MGAGQAKTRKQPQGVAKPSDGVSIDLDTVPVRVENVKINGLSRTKDDYVSQSVQELFKATTFNELVFKASVVQSKLEKLGCFRDVGIIIDVSNSSPDGYEVIYNVRESGRFVGGINTMIGANEGSLVLGCRLPNILGRGERINLEHTIGSDSNKSSLLTAVKPLGGSWNADLSATLFHHKNPAYWSSYTVFSTGALLDFAFESAQKVRHNMQWEGAWRQLEASSRQTSFAVREQSGHSFKSSLRHIMTVDHRDHPIFPSSGVLLKLVQEYAGLGGDVAFVKHDSELQANIPLPHNLVLQGALRFGVLRPLDARDSTHNISDLFFLGGPQTVRGFEMRSLGARSGSDALGGKAYWASAVHLYMPLPFGLGRGSFGEYFRTHAFVNAGNINDSSFNTEDFAQSFQTMLKDFRASYGIGLAIRLGQLARIEINYCWPYRFSKGDRLVRGVQLGLGIDFL